LGVYPSSRATAWTRARVSAPTYWWSLSARDAVEMETPVRAAMSRNVAMSANVTRAFAEKFH
jgi:hypothetical protein